MLSPIKAFNYVNSIIQSNTGYSFSFSNLPNKINKVALPAIALAVGYIVAVNAEDLPTSKCCCNYDNCITLCVEGALQQENFLHELGKCVRICVNHFSGK